MAIDQFEITHGPRLADKNSALNRLGTQKVAQMWEAFPAMYREVVTSSDSLQHFWEIFYRLHSATLLQRNKTYRPTEYAVPQLELSSTELGKLITSGVHILYMHPNLSTVRSTRDLFLGLSLHASLNNLRMTDAGICITPNVQTSGWVGVQSVSLAGQNVSTLDDIEQLLAANQKIRPATLNIGALFLTLQDIEHDYPMTENSPWEFILGSTTAGINKWFFKGRVTRQTQGVMQGHLETSLTAHPCPDSLKKGHVLEVMPL